MRVADGGIQGVYFFELLGVVSSVGEEGMVLCYMWSRVRFVRRRGKISWCHSIAERVLRFV